MPPSEKDAVAAARKYYGSRHVPVSRNGADILGCFGSGGKALDLARRGRARHLVLLRALAVLDARLAGQDTGAEALLPDLGARHRLRHHLLLGRPHDDDGHALHEGGAVPRRLHPRARPRREGRQDVEVEGQRRRSALGHGRVRRRRAALHHGRDGRAGPRHQAVAASASRATATSRPSSGTPRASAR